MLMVGYFKGIDSERGIPWAVPTRWRCGRLLGCGVDNSPPDHSSVSRARRLDVETHAEVFGRVLDVLREMKLLVSVPWFVYGDGFVGGRRAGMRAR